MKLKLLNTLSLFDYILLGCSLILIVIGILFIYSAAIDMYGALVAKHANEYINQIKYASIGIVLLVLASFIDYRRYIRYLPVLYLITVALLIIVHFCKIDSVSAHSWLVFRIGSRRFRLGQPSEPAKLVFIMCLAVYLDRSKQEQPLKRFLIATLIMAIPAMLILVLQPDMGTALVFVAIFIFMCFVADIPLRYILFITFMGLFTVILAVLPTWQSFIYKKSLPILAILTNSKLRLIVIASGTAISIIGVIGQILFKEKYYYWITYVASIFTICFIASWAAEAKVLDEYQKKRLVIFLDPYADKEGFGYHLIQSLIAIGAGCFNVRGFLQGTQSHYQYLPTQSTDFIFSIMAEEWGFLGGVILFALYVIMLIRIMLIMKKTTNVYAMYVSTGIFGMFLFHFIINVGMVMGIMPVIGIPLPFLSFGGSALITQMVCIGILESIHYRRLDFSVY